MYSLEKNRGVTLLEILMVLVIATMILYLSLQQYYSYRRDAEVQQVQYNVDMLFQAITRFFQQNCNSTLMKEYFSPRSLTVYPSTLQNQGFLTTALPRVPSIVYYGGSAPDGYVVQLNQWQVTPGPLPTRQVPRSPTGALTDIGSISVWQAQVAVNLNPDKSPEVLAASLGADCLSSASTGWGGEIVLPCDSGSPGTFAVFSRMPSDIIGRQDSSYSAMRPAMEQFKEMYTTDPITILLEPSATAQRNAQYFYCKG